MRRDERMLFLLLLTEAGEDGTLEVSLRGLARDLGVSRQRLSNALAKLEAGQFVSQFRANSGPIPGHRGTFVTFCDYGTYRDFLSTSGPIPGQFRANSGPTGGPQKESPLAPPAPSLSSFPPTPPISPIPTIPPITPQEKTPDFLTEVTPMDVSLTSGLAGTGATPQPPSKPRVFRKPTVDEVRAYCDSRLNGVDPGAFVDFYESKGWMIGKNPMKDWKAAVRTWERGRGERAGSGGKAARVWESALGNLGRMPYNPDGTPNI